MAISLQINNLSKKYNKPLFEEVDLSISGKQKIGLIGDNGSGKSTFLKVLAGLENPDSGEILWSRNAKIGFLEQEIVSDGLEASGGEKKIQKLTELFYGGFDVLLLDEPDNHLDIENKLWFRELIDEFEGIAIVISHDRMFLEKNVEKIWNLDNAKIREYKGSYEKFKQIFEDERESQTSLWQTQEKERVRLAEVVNRFRESAKANSKLAGRYRGMVKRYDKWVSEMVKKPNEVKALNLKIKLGEQHHKKTALYIKYLSKAYGKNEVLKDINLHIFCGEKMAILAPNGSGKSTLLNILTGNIKADGGHFRIGEGLKIGYYAQEHMQALDENLTMIDELQKSQPFEYYEGIAYLKRFLFEENNIKNKIKYLSGGQKSRLQLAKFLATNPDILILDEPTNHLDLKTVISLERFLKDYGGTLVLVSHDARLVENVVEKRYKLKNGKLAIIQ